MQSDPKTLEETAQEATAILVGTVTKQETRYGDDAKRSIFTDYTFNVEDPILAETAVRSGTEVHLTFRGGTIGEETQDIGGMPMLVVGERYLLMLRPKWAEIRGIPLVGADQGLFRVATDPKTNIQRVFDASGAPVVLEGDTGFVRSTGEARRLEDGVPLDVFVGRLRRELPRIKQAPPPERPQVNRDDPGALKTFSRPVAAEPPRKTDQTESQAPLIPTHMAEPERPEKTYEQAVGNGEPRLVSDKDRLAIQPRFVTDGIANVPIVVNQFPPTFAPWSPEDQFQMASWNHYASDIFRVSNNPTNWAYGNGVFDLAGWPDSTVMNQQFGVTWADLGNPWAVCFRRFNGGTIIEADIALNPAQNWTLDDESVYNGSGLRSFRRTMTHELGHMWGLAHEFNFLSVMNYPPDNYRPFPLPFMDDAEGIRRRYPARKVETTDLGIFLFRSAGSQNWVQADFPSSVRVGSSFTVTNYQLENVGTRAVSTPAVEWYLTAARNFSSTTFFLGTTTYPTLNPFVFFDPPSTARTLTVPAGVPPGSYFLAAFIRGDESMNTNGFQGNNSRSFSRTKINVLP
jgi:Matrixin